MDLSLPAVIGITTPGKSTVLRNGKMGNDSGNSSLLISASSSGVIKGINSEFSSKSCSDNLSKLKNFVFVIFIVNAVVNVVFNYIFVSKNRAKIVIFKI